MKVEHKKPIAIVVGLRLIADPNLTPAAKGVFAFLRALRPGADIDPKDLLKYNKIGKQGLETCLEELKEHGYLQIDEDLWVVNDNPALGPGASISSMQFAPKQDKPKKSTKSKQDWEVQRLAERKEFMDEVKKAVGEVSFDFPRDQLEKFLKYWTEIDSMNPMKKMPFQAQRTFNIKRRMRTWYDRWKDKQQQGKL